METCIKKHLEENMLIYTKKILLFSFIAIFTISCHQQKVQLKQAVLLLKDKDGLYKYDPVADTVILLFKAGTNDVFLDAPITSKNNVISFGLMTGKEKNNKKDYTEGVTYYHRYYTLNLLTGESRCTKKTSYRLNYDKPACILSEILDSTGNVIEKQDTIDAKIYSLSSYRGISMTEFCPGYFPSASVMDKNTYSESGNLYFIERNDTSMLLEYKEPFSLKMNSGYLWPQIDPAGDNVYFVNVPQLMSNEKIYLQKINLSTGFISTIKKGEFSSMSFSADGNFILFRRYLEPQDSIWSNEIWTLNLQTLEEKKVGSAGFAYWMKE